MHSNIRVERRDHCGRSPGNKQSVLLGQGNPKPIWNKRIQSHYVKGLLLELQTELHGLFFWNLYDDIRTGGPTEASCKATSQRVASRINYLGQQDAAQERGQPAQQPRAWAGAKCCSLEGTRLYVFSTQEKWLKAQAMVLKWNELLLKEKLDTESFSELEKDVGLLVHIS